MESFSLWHWIIVAVLLYVAYSVARRLRGSSRPKSDGMTIREAELIVNAYGKILEHLGPIPGSTVADESKLPFPKQKIKTAILVALYAAKTPQERELLKTGYLYLADFQPGVGARDVGINLTNVDVSKLDDAALMSLAKNMADTTAESDKWITQANNERDQLLAELRAVRL